MKQKYNIISKPLRHADYDHGPFPLRIALDPPIDCSKIGPLNIQYKNDTSDSLYFDCLSEAGLILTLKEEDQIKLEANVDTIGALQLLLNP